MRPRAAGTARGLCGHALNRQLAVRFVAITHISDEVHCQATVAGKFLDGGTPCMRLDLRVHNQAGEPRLTGTAVVALPGPRCA